MSSSTQKNKFTQSILALIFFVMLCAPISISKVSVTHLLSVSRTGGVFSENSILGPALAQAQTPPAANPPQTTTKKVDSSGSEWFTKIMMALGTLVLGIGAFFAWVTGKILDYSLQSLVFGMGDLINTGGVGVAIDTAWKIIRDFCNLAFIFGFIYLGIRTIIDPDNSSVKRTLSQIIMGALLINFSLYIAKFIIDFSNFTAYSIYNALVTGTGSISGLMFHMLGVTSFYSKGVLDTQQFANVTGGGMFAFYIMGLILLLVAAFIFISAAILIVIRFVALVFLMIASPVLFAGFVFPQTASTTKMLWGKLFSYSFFAPLYLLLTLISLMVMKSFTTVMSGGNKLSGTLSNSSAQLDAFGVVVSFIVVIFFLTNSLLIAKKLSVFGGDTAVDWAKRGMGATTAGLAARGMRASVGQLAHKDANNQRIRDMAAMPGLKGWSARQELKLVNKIADSSFDARNIKGAGKAMGIGEGRKGGYATVKKEVEAEHMKFAKDQLGEVGEDDHSVKQRMSALAAAEDKLKQTKRAKESTPEQIEAEEKLVAEAKFNLDKEKNRRILGSSFTTDVKKAQEDLDEIYKNIKEGQKKYADFVKQGATEEIAIMKANLELKEGQAIAAKKKLSELAATSAGQKGYAAVLQESGRLSTWPAGRLVSHEKAAGDSIKKAYEKKLRKTKDEVQNEAIVEAIKSSNKA